MAPAKTPVALPRRVAGAMPARSSASQDVSRSMRCCGSITSASLGLMPKKAASKQGASSTNPPWTSGPSAAPAPSHSSRSQPRSPGSGVMPSPPADTSRQRSSGELTPPG